MISWRGGKGAWKHTDWEHADAPWRSFDRVILWPDWEGGSQAAFYELGRYLAGLRDDGQWDFVNLPPSITDKGSADAADFTESEIFRIIRDHTVNFDDWAVDNAPRDLPTESVTEFEYDDDAPEEVISAIYRRGGYYDIERILTYLADDLAYIQTNADRGLTTSLAWADGVGYWHMLHEERNRDLLATAIGMAREEAAKDLTKEQGDWQPATYNGAMKHLDAKPTMRDLQEAAVHLTTRMREEEVLYGSRYEPLPRYNIDNRRIAAADGILTFRRQCISLPSQTILRKNEVREYGLVFDEGWTDLTWEAGAYGADTEEAHAVRTLLNNLGDFPLVVAEMLAGMDRRIAILHSQSSGVGKSMFVGLLKTALGSLVETAMPSELTKRAMGSQFPHLNNSLTRCRVLVVPEVNTVGLENVNFAKLVHLTGETHLTTERKYQEAITLPRLGNVLLTMGEVQIKDSNGAPMIQWHEIQGLFDEYSGDGRLRVWDIDAANGQRIAQRHYDEVMTTAGQLAFVDWLVQSMHSGKPDSRTPAVLEHINELFNTSRDVATASGHYSPQLDKADAVIKRMTEWTEIWDHKHDVCDLAMIIEGRLEAEQGLWQDRRPRCGTSPG